MKRSRILVAGNPNSGKSTLFNALSGLHQKTANFPGVTVESLQSALDFGNGIVADLVDLPGTYSLYPQSEDEKVACREIIQASLDARGTPSSFWFWMLLICFEACFLLAKSATSTCLCWWF